MDRVELAFRKFDLNKDGFLSRDEFDLVSKKTIIYFLLILVQMLLLVELLVVELLLVELLL